MLPANHSLNLVFTKGVSLTPALREAILQREPGTVDEYHLTSGANDSVDAELEARLSSSLVGLAGIARVVLHGFTFEESIPIRLLLILGSQPIRSVERIEEHDGLISFVEHRPMEDRKSRVLLVFPGSIIPVIMGSHRRAYQLAANLAAHGCPVDLLITGGSKSIIQGAKPLLYQISPRVSHYKHRRPILSPRQRWRKRFERCLRVVQGIFKPPPDLFTERLTAAASETGSKALRKQLEGRHYRTVIVSYAWLSNIRKMLEPAELKEITWICDTHDVQFVRNETDNTMERRYFRCTQQEKECEITVLDSFAKVLAISEPDAISLRAELGEEKVMFTPTGFDYALGEPKIPDPEAPIFGFIGRLMRANDKALKEILDVRWPAIHRRWPNATLRIAGSICKSKLLATYDPLPRGIILDHIVIDLSTWYRSIDIMLNPVMVQGGMNFKSMEAIMAGKLLLTNTMGTTCLGNPTFAISAETPEETVSQLEIALSDPASYISDRQRIRDEAREIFGDASANRHLLKFLVSHNERIALRSVSEKPQRVLIQCGDHLENRIRITALAQGIRARGHYPIVLVYKTEFTLPFLSLGIDAVAIEQFELTQSEKHLRRQEFRKIKEPSGRYKDYDLDDISTVWQLQKPDSFTKPNRRKTVGQMLRHIDRCAAMLEHVAPDQLIVWNGFTGWVANILRHHSRRHQLPSYWLERSIFQDGVFIDPLGTNGNSELSRLNLSDLKITGAASATRSMQPYQAIASAEKANSLKNAGPWKNAQKIVFIPLQVQADTNILLYSPHYETMADFILGVYRTYHCEGVALIVRPHPEEIIKDLNLPNLADVYVDSTGGLDEWLEVADLVVTINSTVGMQALFKGTPVKAFGHGIYTGKGFTNGITPNKEELLNFWNTLVNHYTSTPDNPFPRCLERTLPTIDPQAYHPKNHKQIDPDLCLHTTEDFRRHIQAAVAQTHTLWVVTNDSSTIGNLDLDYRRTRAAFSESGLANHVIRSFALPADTDIRCISYHSGEEPYIVIAQGSAAIDTPAIDKYGWIISTQHQTAITAN